MKSLDQIRAAIKWLRSFSKRDWELADYPVRFLHRPEPASLGRLVAQPWTAQVVNWWPMRGDGASQEEALENLDQSFRRFKETASLPRPGRGAPLKLEFASSAIVDRHSGLADELLRRVLDMEPEDVLITDESSLWDFHCEETNEPYLRKIEALYGVDVSDLERPTLSAICVRIAERQAAEQPVCDRD